MVGLDKFKDAFEAYSDNYVIIGGTACEITLKDTEMRPRATHDIDMIVIIENITPEFGSRFWDFIHEGGYRPEKRSNINGRRHKYELYRFLDGKDGYPEMIELLSRHPNMLGNPKGIIIEPLPIDENVSSLSAIIMDDDYYHFTIDHSKLTKGIRHATPVALVALKARAYLNLTQDKNAGKHVNTKDIKKHRSDVLKNVAIMENDVVYAPKSIVECVHKFVISIQEEKDELFGSLANALGIDENSVGLYLERLDSIFKITP